MRKADVALLGICAAIYGALLATTWRATPDRTDIAVILYIAAGVLEAGGVATIGYDLAARRQRIRDYDASQRRVEIIGKTAFDLSWAAEIAVVGGQPPTLAERVTALEQRAQGERDRTLATIKPIREILETQIGQAEDAVDTASRKRDQQIIDLIGPSESPWPAWLGFAGLLLGVLVGTAANILSATN